MSKVKKLKKSLTKKDEKIKKAPLKKKNVKSSNARKAENLLNQMDTGFQKSIKSKSTKMKKHPEKNLPVKKKAYVSDKDVNDAINLFNNL